MRFVHILRKTLNRIYSIISLGKKPFFYFRSQVKDLVKDYIKQIYNTSQSENKYLPPASQAP